MWKRILQSALCCLGCVLLLAPACGDDDNEADTGASAGPDASDAQPLSVVVDSRFAPAPDTLGDGVQDFLDLLTAVGFDPQLATESAGASILEAVNSGEVDIGIDILALQTTGNSALDEVLDLYGEGTPFGLQGAEYVAYLDEEGIDLLESILADNGFENVRILPVIANTGQAAAMSRGPIDDTVLSTGVLMRSFGFGQSVLLEAYPNMDFLPATGGSPTNIVDGFNDGSLYAAEFVNPCIDATTILDLVDDEVITHYYLDNWQSPNTLFFLMYRADLFDNSADDLGRLRAAQQASLSASFPRLMRRQSECLAELAAQGIQIQSLPADVLAELEAATFTVLEQIADDNSDVASVLDSIRLFVKRNRRWLNGGPVDRDTRFDWPGYESDI